MCACGEKVSCYCDTDIGLNVPRGERCGGVGGKLSLREETADHPGCTNDNQQYNSWRDDQVYSLLLDSRCDGK